MDLEVKNLKISLSGKTIINDLSIRIEEGEFIGIIGPNGSGKSTLLKSIYRILKPEKGEIYINGRDLRLFSLRESAREIAVVAQHNNYDFGFSVLDMVLMGRSPHKNILDRDNKEDYKIALDSLKKVEMDNFIDRDYNTLSGGEKQRIILARALTQDTNCLILDEPTNHLDIKYQIQFMNIAKDLNITIIAAIHDLNMAGIYCDRIYALDKGEIVASGKPIDIITEEFIKDLFEVDAEIIKDKKTGNFNIVYRALKK